MRGTYDRDAQRVIRWPWRCGNDRQRAARRGACDDARGRGAPGRTTSAGCSSPIPDSLAGPIVV